MNNFLPGKLEQNAPLFQNANRTFLLMYEPYIKAEWRSKYFSYDTMKAKYKSLKEQAQPDLQKFEKQFFEAIEKVDNFLNTILHDIQRDLRTISDTCDFLNSNSFEDVKKKKELGRTVELFIRSIFEKCRDCKRFYKLNHYIFCKIAKKFEKLIEQGIKKRDDFMPWRDYPSNELFNQKFGARIDEILYLTRKSVDMYSEKFRKTYPSLAIGELEFVKNKDRETVRTRFWIGLKLGLIICGVVWLISDSYQIPNSLRFWTRPGLYMYTTVGNLLLFRFLWALSIFVWSRHEVNYIAVFQLHDDRPNILLVINQTVTQFVLYTANLILFFRANTHPSSLNDTFLRHGCPALLIVMCGCYELYEHLNFREERVSRGVFTKSVVYDCLMAPFAKVTFRDNYAADTMTSFTKVISDFVYGSCWLVSGAFLKPDQTNDNFGSDYLMCTTDNVKLFIVVTQLYPQWVRIMQCVRNYYLTGLFVHLRNITKYLTTVLVILFGMFYTTFNTLYICVIVFSTLYKWWWDVVMDWGLFECLPVINGTVPDVNLTDCLRSDRRGAMIAQPARNSNTNNSESLSPLEAQTINDTTDNKVTPPSFAQKCQTIFLRQNLLYPSYMIYYVCIVVDLLLRFLWIVSLLPPTFFGTLIGPKMSFCLASLEIARRAMWGIFRLEFEHLKFVKKGTVGFHEPKYIRHRANSLAQIIGPRETSGKENRHSDKDLSHLHSVDVDRYAQMHTKEYDDVEDQDMSSVGFGGGDNHRKLNRAATIGPDTIKLSHAQSVVNFFSSHGGNKETNSSRKPSTLDSQHNVSTHSQYSNPPSERGGHLTHSASTSHFRTGGGGGQHSPNARPGLTHKQHSVVLNRVNVVAIDGLERVMARHSSLLANLAASEEGKRDAHHSFGDSGERRTASPPAPPLRTNHTQFTPHTNSHPFTHPRVNTSHNTRNSHENDMIELVSSPPHVTRSGEATPHTELLSIARADSDKLLNDIYRPHK